VPGCSLLAGSLAAALLIGLALCSGPLLVGLQTCSGLSCCSAALGLPLLVWLLVRNIGFFFSRFTKKKLSLLPLINISSKNLEYTKEYFSLRNHMYNTTKSP